MISPSFLGFGGFGQDDPGAPRVLAIISNRDISQARNLLTQLATKVKGGSLTQWQRRSIEPLARDVAMRTKRGVRPALSREQAMELWQIVAG